MKTAHALMYSYAGYVARYVYLLILIPFYGRVLGVVGYGQVLAAMSLYTVVWAVTNYGFSTSGAREVAMAHASPASHARIFGRHIHARVILTIIGLTIGIVGTWVSPVLRAMPWMGAIATVLGISQSFNLGWYFQGLGRFKVSTLTEVTGFAISLALILMVVRGPADGIYVLLSLLIASLVTACISYTIAIRDIPRFEVRVRDGVALIRESTPLFLLGGVVTLFLSSTTYLLSLFASVDVVGSYGTAERLSGIVLAMMIPTNQVLFSRISQRIGNNGIEAQGLRAMRLSLVVMVASGVVASIIVAVFAPYLVRWVLGDQFVASVRLLQWLACIYPAFAFTQVVNLYIMIPMKMDKIAMKISIISTGVQLIIFLCLSSLYQAEGAVIARVIGEFMTAVILAAAMVRLNLWQKIFRRDDSDASVIV